MADVKISNLANLAAAADDDELVIVDVSVGITKKIQALVLVNTAHTHDGETLQIDGINSNGGAFPFTTSGKVTFSQQLDIPTIDLTGGQLAFPAGAIPSADPNTLDDYEEGEFQVTFVTSGGTITINASFDTLAYTKVGRKITIQGHIAISSVNVPTGDIYLQNLPIASGTLTERADWSTGPCYLRGANGNAGPIVCHVADASTILYLRENGTVAFGNNIAPHFDAGTTFVVEISYIAA